jgi:hypothetical protein
MTFAALAASIILSLSVLLAAWALPEQSVYAELLWLYDNRE